MAGSRGQIREAGPLEYVTGLVAAALEGEVWVDAGQVSPDGTLRLRRADWDINGVRNNVRSSRLHWLGNRPRALAAGPAQHHQS
ncbi:hypothetical protein [Nocardia sp. CY41]|uniref:hypothetical protein n=1 Tax=Nocardia sp. CY41 TaxID=2608686 RepID=UPI00135B597B